ncbi:PREDICTED: 5-hydroxytryptamine receptor 1A-like [Nicrophorus vespilloides]|uniref:5-hydroxytryptamine receptor 1A-like n=1 Tax=Nicrophorus vespilloides TaxID=110193 RepID=A0ABM1MYP1_NICVS|nr:PREDICTED: 5-hydroxytryptamine receptor 1A-like [Nicrophorus vespilloides]XP_017779692.1 PREDICTED: 5-hydroxytryptamine receptor 1A-like [Nicrophorus vespilloides]
MENVTLHYPEFWYSRSYYEGNVSTLNATEPTKFVSTLRLYDILIPAIGSLAIILNFAVIISSGLILKKGQQPRSTYLFLGNVAMTDFVTAVSVVFGEVYPKSNRDHYICALQIGMIVSSTLASVFSVGLIAIDRFLYILHGLNYQRWVYPTRARVCIAISWFIGLVIGFLPLFGWYGDTNNGRKCWFILLAPKDLIKLTVIAGGIPLLTVMVLYSIILYHAIKNIYRLQRAEQTNETDPNGLRIFRGKSVESVDSVVQTEPGQPVQNVFKRMFMRKPTSKVKGPNKWRAIKVVFFTSGSFLITWGPYFIASLLYVYCGESDGDRCKNLSILVASPLAILGFFNCLINPVIYAWWHKGFREFVKKTWGSIRRRRRSIQNNSTSTTKTHSKGEESSSKQEMESRDAV